MTCFRAELATSININNCHYIPIPSLCSALLPCQNNNPHAQHIQIVTIMVSHPHDGRIPHTCAYCEAELVEPKSFIYSWDEKGKHHTVFKFEASGSRAQEAAADGCLFWEWFIRDYLDDEGKRKRHHEDSGIYFEFTFTDYEEGIAYRQYPYPLRRVYASRHHNSGSSGHGSLKILADEGKLSCLFCF